jgi:hypothetical protein
MLPEDAAATVDAWIKSRTGATPASEEPTDESSTPDTVKPAVAPPAAAPPPPQKKADSSGPSGSALDKQRLDALINRTVPPPAPAPQADVPKQ